MLFASRYSNFYQNIQSGKTVTQAEGGAYRTIQTEREIGVQFDQSFVVPVATRRQALDIISGRVPRNSLPGSGWGAHPLLYADTRETTGEHFEAHDLAWRISWLDTEDASMVDPDDRELVEARLLEMAGQDFFLVEAIRLPAPWPNYADESAPRIVELVRSLGLNVEMVISYERENKNRKVLIAELEGLDSKIAEEKKAAEALTVTV